MAAGNELSFSKKMARAAQLAPPAQSIELEEDFFGELHDIDPAERTWHAALLGTCNCGPTQSETEDGKVVWTHQRATKEQE